MCAALLCSVGEAILLMVLSRCGPALCRMLVLADHVGRAGLYEGLLASVMASPS
jgi:hypothetical protein